MAVPCQFHASAITVPSQSHGSSMAVPDIPGTGLNRERIMEELSLSSVIDNRVTRYCPLQCGLWRVYRLHRVKA